MRVSEIFLDLPRAVNILPLDRRLPPCPTCLTVVEFEHDNSTKALAGELSMPLPRYMITNGI